MADSLVDIERKFLVRKLGLTLTGAATLTLDTLRRRYWLQGDPDPEPPMPMGGVNFFGRSTLGSAVNITLDYRTLVPQGNTLQQSPTDYKFPPVIGGHQVTYLASGTVAAPVAEQFTVGSVLVSDPNSAQQVPANSITRIRYTLSRNAGATAATSTGTWTNPNSATGNTSDSSNARNANTITSAASGSLRLTYAAPVNKTALNINTVRVNVFGQYTAGTVSPGEYTLSYSIDGGANFIFLEGANASTNFVLPFIITSTIGGDWNKLNNFVVRVDFTAPASATPSTITIDTVLLEVAAELTQTI